MNNDSPISKLLHDSLPKAEISSRFNAEVWQRIQRQSVASANHWLNRYSNLVSELIMRPVYASFALLILVSVSAGTATLQAADSNERRRGELVQRHITALDANLYLASKR
jgi:hypothetical protein